MSDAEHARVTADETALERQYSNALAERAKDAQRFANGSVNNSWTTPASMDVTRSGELIGRIGLNSHNDTIDGANSFYIGTAMHTGESYQVYSWAAPIAACTYYRQPADRAELDKLCDSVVGVRVFAHHHDEIADFQDEITGDYAPDDLFPKRKLQVPRAPGSRPAVSDVIDDVKSEPDNEVRVSAVAGDLLTQDDAAPTINAGGATAPVGPAYSTMRGPVLRAPDLLRRQLAKPKTAAMSAVLATLQPDQYEAITKPSSESQFLQGHPGTGKTIIGVHRAAYLLNSETPFKLRPRGHVLILGPTAEYSDHIRTALRKLIDDDSTYVVMSIPSLLEELAGLPESAVSTTATVYNDVDSELARLVDVAYRKAKSRLEGAQRPDRASTYSDLVGLLQDPPPEGLEAEWVKYLRELPQTFEEMKPQRVRRYRGLMAYIGALTDRAPRGPGHVIVDEAQDIHPIEWEVLGRLGNTGGWTILGDLNQRRTDHTFSTWDAVANLLAIEEDDGRAPVQLLERGYRSTAQIIQFANRLLPSRDRALYSLQQDGEAPRVIRVGAAGDLIFGAVEAAEKLCERVGAGTVGVIAVDVDSAQKAIVRRGWTRDGADPFAWKNAERKIRLMPPDRARGLEFDGVVVVEPSDFPENVGRKGVLYTALTRANRFLVVVHHRALPKGIKSNN